MVLLPPPPLSSPRPPFRRAGSCGLGNDGSSSPAGWRRLIPFLFTNHRGSSTCGPPRRYLPGSPAEGGHAAFFLPGLDGLARVELPLPPDGAARRLLPF